MHSPLTIPLWGIKNKNPPFDDCIDLLKAYYHCLVISLLADWPDGQNGLIAGFYE